MLIVVDPRWRLPTGPEQKLAHPFHGADTLLAETPGGLDEEATGYWDIGDEGHPRVAEVNVALMSHEAWSLDPRSLDPSWAVHEFPGGVIALQLTV